MTARTADQVFGKNVKEFREEHGWSMSTLADRLQEAGLTNFHAATVGRMERGERPVRLSEALVIASILNVGMEDLVTGPDKGNEGLELDILLLEDFACRAGFAVDVYESTRDELLKECERLESELASGEHLEHAEEVRQSIARARAFAMEDRFEYWLGWFRGASPEDRREVMARYSL